MGYIEKKILDAYKSCPSSVLELHARVESNATWFLLNTVWKSYYSYYLSKWLMDKILTYDKACKSDYEKILV